MGSGNTKSTVANGGSVKAQPHILKNSCARNTKDPEKVCTTYLINYSTVIIFVKKKGYFKNNKDQTVLPTLTKGQTNWVGM